MSDSSFVGCARTYARIHCTRGPLSFSLSLSTASIFLFDNGENVGGPRSLCAGARVYRWWATGVVWRGTFFLFVVVVVVAVCLSLLPPVDRSRRAVRARSARSLVRDVSDSPSRRKHQTWPSYGYTLIECVPG